MALLAMALHKRGIDALSLKGSRVAIRTDVFTAKRAYKASMIVGSELNSTKAASWW